MGRACG
jgi:hypothetical protein